jgi:hypothetical protein
MKKKCFLFFGIFVLLANIAVRAQVNNGAIRPTCGTLTRQKNIVPPFDRPDPMALMQAPEILLYIRFDATQVLPGFDNAATFRSSIISSPVFLPAANLFPQQRDEIASLVQDDFSPFNVRVTTDFNEFLAYPAAFREMAVVTTSPTLAGQNSDVGGVAPFSGSRVPNAISFIFSATLGNVPATVAGTISHEIGHLFGLEHQSLFGPSCQFLSEYHPGFGTGRLGFNPIMGSGIGDGIYNWFAQACPTSISGIPQNDYVKINSSVSIRPDDFPNLLQPGMPAMNINEITGVLEQAGDVDIMLINFRSPGKVTVTSNNIDLKVTVLTPGGQVMGVFNDPADRNVVIPSVPGARFLRIEGESNINMSSQFMTGTYHVSLN